jgi:CheY-like chemotaxis protein
MSGPLIVVVEDDECIRSSIAEVLEMEGYRVLAFANGLEATKGLEGQPQPCVILLDWMMPIMGGEAFLKARERMGDTYLQIPVIVLSAVSERACGKPGVNTCLGKPVDLNRLLDAVEQLCVGVTRKCA